METAQALKNKLEKYAGDFLLAPEVWWDRGSAFANI